MERFAIRCDDVWRLYLAAVGVTPASACVEVADEALTFRFGWLEESIPLRDVGGVAAIGWPWFYGVGLRVAPGATLGLVGSTQGVAAVTLARPRPIKVPFTMFFDRVAASFESRAGFVEAVEARVRALA
jgi:hypothetical protein